MNINMLYTSHQVSVLAYTSLVKMDVYLLLLNLENHWIACNWMIVYTYTCPYIDIHICLWVPWYHTWSIVLHSCTSADQDALMETWMSVYSISWHIYKNTIIYIYIYDIYIYIWLCKMMILIICSLFVATCVRCHLHKCYPESHKGKQS